MPPFVPSASGEEAPAALPAAAGSESFGRLLELGSARDGAAAAALWAVDAHLGGLAALLAEEPADEPAAVRFQFEMSEVVVGRKVG